MTNLKNVIFDIKDIMSEYDYKNMRFLIVDNIKPSQEILKQFVMRLTSKQVDSTHYAQDVASICQQKSYDVILLGYDLGDNQKNGQQILEELRVNSYINRSCIIILITAEISQAMVLAALEHRPDHYLCKPYSLNDLHKRLRSCLHKKRMMAKIYQALDDKNPTLVISRCKKALEDNTPYKTECLGIISRQYFELEHYGEAKKIYLEHQNQVNCQWATIGLGKLALHEQKLEQAEALFKLLIKNYPLYLSSYDWLAVTYEKQFHFLFAEQILEEALKLSPRSLNRLQKYADLCIKNKHYDKATLAYENNYKLAHNSIHHCADNTINFVKAVIEHSPSLSLVDAKKVNSKAFLFMKKMTRDFKEVDIKIQSHLLGACLYEITKERDLAHEEFLRGEVLLKHERDNIPHEKLIGISSTLMKLNKDSLASQILISEENAKAITHMKEQPSEEEKTINLKDKAQAYIELGLSLYAERKYPEAISRLQTASSMFPMHAGIKVNLLQVLLVSHNDSSEQNKNLERVKELLVDMSRLPLNKHDAERLKKMQKKYQLIAGI